MVKKGLVVLVFVIGVLVGRLVLVKSPDSEDAPPSDQVVTGIGGVFFKSDDPKRLREWYRRHLGIAGESGNVNFFWRDRYDPGLIGYTVWAPFPRETGYFGSGTQDLMVNYRVRNLDTLLSRLKSEQVQQIGVIEEHWYGRFAWILDGEGNRVELWEPAKLSAEEFERRLRAEKVQ
jgi:catechol 2,3-dioxygenase-like lactoylglutathione lyase family enzyme